MFPSFNYDDHDNLKSSSFPSDHQNPSSSLFNFPSPFLDEHESPLNQIFFQTLHHHTDMTATSNDLDTKRDATKRSTNKVVVVEKEPLRRRSLGVVPRRRTGKKDRHSKICTAQGVRDRRMRLSLQVARKFFDLQDMLGYDKASKTIEWLFTKSKKAIKDLINHHAQPNNISISTDVKSESFLSECEVVSGSVHEDMANNNNSNKDALVQSCISPKVKDETKTIVSKSSTRESREKARARARSRTREKMMEKYLMNPSLYHEHVQKLGFSDTTPFEGVDVVSPYEPSADMGTIEKFLGHSSSSTTISWPNSGDSSAADFVGFFGNWDLLNGERSSSIFSVTNQVSLAGNPNHEFP